MQNILKGLLTLLILLALGQPANARQIKVILDPGHGGSDNGAVQNGKREADIVLAISKHLAGLLEKDPDFTVALTRNKDKTVSLQKRTQIAEESLGTVFLSIHVNSAPTEKATGAEFYFKNEMPPDEESLFLANRENLGNSTNNATKKAGKLGDLPAILDDLKRNNHAVLSQHLAKDLKYVWNKALQTKGQNIRQAPFHVLIEVPMPSSLVELGYLTNPREAEWLASHDTQKKLAEILYKGLQRFKERLDKVKNPRL